MYIAFNKIILESPGDVSKSVAGEKLERKLAPTDFAMDQIKELKRETFGEEEVKKKKKRKIKGKNPLSCKKKKKRTAEEIQMLKQKKKRKKIRKPKISLEKLAAIESVS